MDTKDNDRKGTGAGGGAKPPLGLRGGTETSHVRQSFSHGRSKSVMVEHKRKRVVVPKPGQSSGGGTSRPASAQNCSGRRVRAAPEGRRGREGPGGRAPHQGT